MLKKVLVIVSSHTQTERHKHTHKNKIMSITENKQKSRNTQNKLVQCSFFSSTLKIQHIQESFCQSVWIFLWLHSVKQGTWNTLNCKETHLSWSFKGFYKGCVPQITLCIRILMSEQNMVKGNETLCWRNDVSE